MEFKVGMKVRVKTGIYKKLVGWTVVKEYHCIGVDFGTAYCPFGHDLGGLLPTKTGLYIHHTRLQPMEIVNV